MILDAKVTIPFTQENPPQCGHLSQNTYYFLVAHSDVKKMIDLEYTMIEEKDVCSPKGTNCTSPSQLR